LGSKALKGEIEKKSELCGMAVGILPVITAACPLLKGDRLYGLWIY